jgi:hypothetical protein
MTIMWGALRPNSEAPSRPWPVELGTANFINTNISTDTISDLKSQPGPIIRLHWLRPESMEAANG